jgi:hypothetical protein
MTTLRCLQDYDDGTCDGPVEYRDALPPSGERFPRCDRHWGARLVEDERIRRTYGTDSDVAPSWIDPSYAGERW